MTDESNVNIEESDAPTLQSNEISNEAEENQSDEAESGGIDYSVIEREDVEALRGEFPELSGISSITELENPLRYGALRDLGLSPVEAYLATSGRKKSADNRYHLFASPAIAASNQGTISEKEMEAARDIFPDISDKEIRKLYKKVTNSERKNYV
jgi:hypothetical protein